MENQTNTEDTPPQLRLRYSMPSMQVCAAAQGEGGSPTPILKPTQSMLESHRMRSQLSRLCNRGHGHQPVFAGRATEAAFYQLGLLKAMLKGT